MAERRNKDSGKGAAAMHGRSKVARSTVFARWGVVVAALVLLATAGFLLVTCQNQTRLLGPEGSRPQFDPIGLNKPTTTVIIVHGIGYHCLGYADVLVSSLFEKLTGGKTEFIEEYFDGYLRDAAAKSREPNQQAQADDASRTASSTPTVDSVPAPRDGSCRIAGLDYDRYSAIKVNDEDDLESRVSAQERLCDYINDHPESTNGGTRKPDVSCHRLSVIKKDTGQGLDERAREYITGFIRRFSLQLTADRGLRVYEVTWSPATRWIKKSLVKLERFNDPDSEHWLNRDVKSGIINSGIADAVAYLADSGILVNFDILQAFCLTFANANSLYEGDSFHCDRSHLSGATGDFSKDNDIYLISHSLGTRVLFDSIGMLAVKTVDPNQADVSGPALLSTIVDKFKRIGAVVPDKYTTTVGSEPPFAEILNERVPEFAKAVRSIYVFTNQVPLLAANLTSPFQRTTDVGMGFQRFLELRNSSGSDNGRLQVVSFHDPDDLLSYNLNCWYYQTVLKHFQETRNVIDREAMDRADKRGTDVNYERWKLRETLFDDHCSDANLGTAEKSLYRQIWDVGTNRIKLVDAAVRLKGFRLPGIAAHPQDVHSNYFVDKTVHGWLAQEN